MGFKSDLSKHMSYIFLLENLATADLLCVCHWLPSSTANLDLNECHMSFARFFFRGWRMHERHADNQDQNSPTFLGCRREFSHFSQKQLMKNVSGLPAKISCKILIALRRDGLNPDHVTSFVTWKLIHLFECIVYVLVLTLPIIIFVITPLHCSSIDGWFFAQQPVHSLNSCKMSVEFCLRFSLLVRLESWFRLEALLKVVKWIIVRFVVCWFHFLCVTHVTTI